jgi:hypothetical protein
MTSKHVRPGRKRNSWQRAEGMQQPVMSSRPRAWAVRPASDFTPGPISMSQSNARAAKDTPRGMALEKTALGCGWPAVTEWKPEPIGAPQSTIPECPAICSIVLQHLHADVWCCQRGSSKTTNSTIHQKLESHLWLKALLGGTFFCLCIFSFSMWKHWPAESLCCCKLYTM